MAYKKLLFRSEAREALLKGTGALADAVRITLGPRSRRASYLAAASRLSA